GLGSTRVLACTCPASSPDRFRDEAAEIAAVVFAIRMMLCLTFLASVRQSAMVPGVGRRAPDPGTSVLPMSGANNLDQLSPLAHAFRK
ncbi:MAG: hypothetical protein WBV90_14010, partial [Terrimicrobiaceae bacterium]